MNAIDHAAEAESYLRNLDTLDAADAYVAVMAAQAHSNLAQLEPAREMVTLQRALLESMLHPTEPAPVADPARITEVLADHQIHDGVGKNLGQYRTEYTCDCGASVITDGHAEVSLLAARVVHQSDVLLATGTFRSEAEVKAEALTEAAAAARQEAADSRTNNGRCESEGLADWLDEYAKTVAS